MAYIYGMTVIELIRFFFTGLTGVSYCIRCGRRTLSYDLCPDCKKAVTEEINEERRCLYCGKRLVSEKNICMECRTERIIKSADYVYPLMSYTFYKKDWLFQWKITGVRAYSSFFAYLLYLRILYIKNNFTDNFYIVPVPPRPGKIKNKGWDQIDDIVRILSHSYSLEVRQFLVRNRTSQMKKLDRQGRIGSVESLYSLIDEDIVCDRDIILIDDLITTGSTIEGCARELKKITDKKIYVLSLFIAE